MDEQGASSKTQKKERDSPLEKNTGMLSEYA